MQLSCLRGKNWHDIVGAGAAIENSVDYFHPLLTAMPWTPVSA